MRKARFTDLVTLLTLSLLGTLGVPEMVRLILCLLTGWVIDAKKEFLAGVPTLHLPETFFFFGRRK